MYALLLDDEGSAAASSCLTGIVAEHILSRSCDVERRSHGLGNFGLEYRVGSDAMRHQIGPLDVRLFNLLW